MKKVICLDFDGTLVDKQNCIHPRDREILAINREDCLFIPSTGRPLHGVRHTFNAAGLFVDQPIPLPMVLLNGATTFFPGEEICSFRPFPLPVQRQLVTAALAAEDVSTFFFGFDSLDILHPAPLSGRLAERFGLNSHPFNPGRTQTRFAKMMAVAEDPAPLEEIAGVLSSLEIELSFSLPTVLEINVAGVNKGQELLTLLSSMGMKDAAIYAAGDGENDLSLFDVASRVFVPAGSPAQIVSLADEIITVEEEGLLTPILRSIGCL